MLVNYGGKWDGVVSRQGKKPPQSWLFEVDLVHEYFTMPSKGRVHLIADAKKYGKIIPSIAFGELLLAAR